MQTRSGWRSTTHSTASLDRPRSARGHAEVKVGRCAMRSPSSSAGTPSRRTSRTRLRSHPASNHAHAATAAAAGPEDKENPGQTESFSVTGSTETTWRLNFSSDESSPAATPTSCERCRIGIWKSLPVCL